MGGINQIGKRGSDFSFFFKMGSSRDIKRLSLTLTLEIWVTAGCQNFKIINGYNMITKNIWSFTAVDVLDFDFSPVKGETSECSPTLTLQCRHVSP